MKEKKHIDRLFQEKLKDFEATPKDAVWDKVNNTLHGDKSDVKPIPIFWKVAGVAALLLLLITAGNLILKDNNSLENTPIVEEVVDDPSLEDENEINDEADTNIISSEENKEITASDKVDDLTPANTDKNKEGTSMDVVSSPSNSTTQNNSKEKTDKLSQGLTESQNNVKTKLADLDQDKTKMDADAKKDELQQREAAQKVTALGNTDKRIVKNDNKDNTLINKEDTNKTVVNKDNTESRVLDKANDKEEAERLTKLPTDVAGTIADENGKDLEKDAKNSIETEVVSLDESNEKEKEEVEKMNRWDISPNVSPVYFNTLGNGSSIDSQFNQNTKTGEVNFSYGIRGSYALSEKLKIRAGVNKVDLGYRTNDVITYRNSEAVVNDNARLRNIRFKDSEQNTTFLSATNLSFAVIPDIIADNIKGSIDQEIGFIEVPLEMEYSLLKKRVGVNVIGGFSAFFLNKNEVYTSLQGDRRLIGEATNINNTSYSANLGLGFNFKFSESIDINLEPTFKYQLNTFSDSSGDFQPYVIGIYSGLRFKF